jgi:hypothetical protein
MIANVLAERHFFSRVELDLRAGSESVPWEIFRGRLLPPGQARLMCTFEAWHLVRGAGEDPFLTIRLDAAAVHVTRSILCTVWEGYHAGDNVYLSRQTEKWVEELVGTIEWPRCTDVRALEDEMICLVFQAVAGASRLPLTSLEAPMPAFTLGDLAYFYCPNAVHTRPARTVREMFQECDSRSAAPLEIVKLLEALLRSSTATEIEPAAVCFMDWFRRRHWTGTEGMALLRQVFNEAALSPYTDFVPRVLEFCEVLERAGWIGVADRLDFLSYLVRMLVRHLTAYDLVTFHHRGANYPDILVLEASLRECLQLARGQPQLFQTEPDATAASARRKRSRRRALRQGIILRCHYEGLPVPDAPTSLGENARILPPPHLPVPENQITDPDRRTRRLFEGDPLAPALLDIPRAVLGQMLADLEDEEELRELGIGIFLDRPLGVAKPPAEPDQTCLLSHEAFSRSIAATRLEELAHWMDFVPRSPGLATLSRKLDRLEISGIAAKSFRTSSTSKLVSMTDAARVADDFLYLRTTAAAARQFFDLFEFSRLPGWDQELYERCLIVPVLAGDASEEGHIVVLDGRFQPRIELAVDVRAGYVRRAGFEFPCPGLRVARVKNGDGSEIKLPRALTLGAAEDYWPGGRRSS